VDVVEREDHDALGGEQLEHAAHRSVGAITLGLNAAGALGGEVRERRKDGGELAQPLPTDAIEPPWMERAEIVVEGVNEEAERKVALEFGCAAFEHEELVGVRARTELSEQARLADSRLADQLESGPGARLGRREEPVDRGELVITRYERR
jgi:hypothetical protein